MTENQPIYTTSVHPKGTCKKCGSKSLRTKTVELPEPVTDRKAVAWSETVTVCLDCNHQERSPDWVV